MLEAKTNEKKRSLAEELQLVVDEIISWTTLEGPNEADRYRTIVAANALDINPDSLQFSGDERNIEAKFAEAIEPLKAALQGTGNLTREDISYMVLCIELLDQLTAINQRRSSLETDNILRGFKKLGDGVIELTLPAGTTIQRAGELLNAAAEEVKGMEYPVFGTFESAVKFWKENEQNHHLHTEPGRTYQFTIQKDSVSKTKSNQVRDHGEGAPLGAIAIAEACERLNTNNKGSLFNGADGGAVWVRGSAPNVALVYAEGWGVHPHASLDEYGSHDSAFAPLVLGLT
jgi:hypothetical protein